MQVFGVDLEYFTDGFRLVGEGSFSWRAKNAARGGGSAWLPSTCDAGTGAVQRGQAVRQLKAQFASERLSAWRTAALFRRGVK